MDILVWVQQNPLAVSLIVAVFSLVGVVSVLMQDNGIVLRLEKVTPTRLEGRDKHGGHHYLRFAPNKGIELEGPLRQLIGQDVRFFFRDGEVVGFERELSNAAPTKTTPSPEEMIDSIVEDLVDSLPAIQALSDMPEDQLDAAVAKILDDAVERKRGKKGPENQPAVPVREKTYPPDPFPKGYDDYVDLDQ